MMRRIAFTIQHINALGGTERSTCAVMNGLVEQAELHLYEVCSRGPAVFGLDSRIATHRLSDRSVSLLASWPRLVLSLARDLRRRRIDTLVAVESTHALYAVPAARLAGCRVIVWEHFNFRTDLGKRKRRWGRRVAARYADDVVTLTERDLDLWREGARPRARLTAIANIAPPVVATPYGIGRRTVLALGRLCAQKGFERLLAAWALVEADPRGAEWRLTIHGDGPDRARLVEQSASLARVAIHPPRADAFALYEDAGLFAASSRREGLPMVLLEAAAHGVPAVAFDCETGPGEIIARDVSGILVPEGDVPALAEALLTLMADPAARCRMSEGARARARTFCRDSILARWSALLRLPAPPAVQSEADESAIEQGGRHEAA
ncbi:glycosyltransferase family 4 protein [Acidomonas methanolica]|uniref:glycosyltransferase family 4 protein n=1 Tax=Acidomonas methanolica TaxID=437 RepID=UPI00211A6E84|nr:glycosyltransferase family 4 protein [Acidomonas methanolica]MCQ9156607.1 glycosyltransferase family 4 protein [Acidomonas methanolica]